MSALKSIKLKAVTRWQLQKTNTGFAATLQGNDGITWTFAAPAGANALYAAQLSLAAGAHQDVDFSSFTDLAGNAVTGIGIYTLHVLPTGGPVKISPSGPVHPLQWGFSSTSDAWTTPDGGSFQVGQQAAQVVSSTAGTLRFTNTGAQPLTVYIVAVCGQ